MSGEGNDMCPMEMCFAHACCGGWLPWLTVWLTVSPELLCGIQEVDKAARQSAMAGQYDSITRNSFEEFV